MQYGTTLQEILEIKAATSKVGSESVIITRPDGPGVFESVLNKYNLDGSYVTKQFKLDASENYA